MCDFELASMGQEKMEKKFESNLPPLRQFSKAINPLSYFQVLIEKYFSIQEDVFDLLYLEIKRMNKFQDNLEVTALHYTVDPLVFAFVEGLKKEKRFWRRLSDLIYSFIDFPTIAGVTVGFHQPAKILLSYDEGINTPVYEEIAMGVILGILLHLSTNYKIKISLKIE